MKQIAAAVLPVLTLSGLAVASDTYQADVWADNWFQMRVNGDIVAEDSVPITTERSFNAEKFSFNAVKPFTISIVAKDFIENDTGLEYIGSRRQQMGDGGIIAQIKSATDVVVTDSAWRCLVIHDAPADKRCEKESNPEAGVGYCAFSKSDEPAGWDTVDFDDSAWTSASVYSVAAVSPKGGYDKIQWDSNAQFIWGPDLETNNTVLCRLTIK